MLYSVIITVTIAAAVIGIFCFKAVRLDKCRRRIKSYLLIPFEQSLKDMEMLVKSCYWEEVFSGSRCSRDIILLVNDDDFVTEKVRSLEREYPIVHCLRYCELKGFLGIN